MSANISLRGEPVRGDPTITPFVQGMVMAGWAADKDRSGCDVLGRCPACRERYVYTFRLHRTTVKACPFCPHHEVATGALA